MKLKTKFGALIFAIALAGGTLVACNPGGNDPVEPAETKYAVNLPAASQDYTITGIDPDGYLKGATVSFTVTVTNPSEKEIDFVRYDNVDLQPGQDGKYSFTMPEKIVTLSVQLKNVKKYVIELSNELKVGGKATVTLTHGGTAIPSFTVELLEGSQYASLNAEDKELTGLAKGTFKLAAFVVNQKVAEAEFEIKKNTVYTIKEAIDEAWEEVEGFNDNSKNTRTNDYYQLTGKIVFIGNLYNDRFDLFLDDGSGDILVHQVKGAAGDVVPLEVGDVVKVSTNLTNYFGIVEGYSSSFQYVNKITEDIPEITPLPYAAFDGTKYDTLAAAYANDAVRQPVTPVSFTATAIKVNEGTEASPTYKNRLQIAGATALNNGRIAFTASVMDVEWVEGVTYEFKGYARDASEKHMNIVITEQQKQLATAVAIDGEESLTLNINATGQLTYTTTPAGAGREVAWSTTNAEVVSIDQEGNYRALAAGNADLKVTVDGHEDVVHVTVNPGTKPATAVELATTLSLEFPGEAETLTATVTPTDTTDFAVWNSSDETVATVANGVVTPLKAGETDITVTYNDDVHATCHVTVTAKHGTTADDPLTVVELLAKDVSEDDYTYFIEGVISKIDTPYSSQHNNISIYITNDNAEHSAELFRLACTQEEAAKLVLGNVVKATGKLTTYNNENQFASGCTIVSLVESEQVTLVKIEGDDHVTMGEKLTLQAKTYPENINEAVAWASSDNEIATVDNEGVVTPVSDGNVTITATANGITASKAITVFKAGQAEVVYKTALFGAENNNVATNQYSGSWYSTTDGFIVDVNYGSNNNNGWNGAIAFGSKANADACNGSIVTREAIDDAVTKVVVNFTSISKTDYIESISLQMKAADAEEWTDVGAFDAQVGEQTVTVTNPTSNMMYRVLILTKNGSGSNGFVRLDRVDFYHIG